MDTKSSVDVVGEPSEALSVALFFQHGAHEEFDGARVELLEAGRVLARRAHLEKGAELFLRAGARLVDFVPQHQHRHVYHLLVRQQLV